MTVPRHEFQIAEPGFSKACGVCEYWRHQDELSSEKSWVIIPTNREIVMVCLNCGNAERHKRVE